MPSGASSGTLHNTPSVGGQQLADQRCSNMSQRWQLLQELNGRKGMGIVAFLARVCCQVMTSHHLASDDFEVQ